MNKKGASLSGWTEIAVIFIMILGVIGLIMSSMNGLYGTNYDTTLKIADNGTQAKLNEYQATIKTAIETGEASGNGLTFYISTTWNMIKSGVSMVWLFLSGGWIESILTGLLMFPPIVATGVRILFVLSIGFIAIKLLMKVRP